MSKGAEPVPLSELKQIDQFRLEGKAGQGAMGIVFKATDVARDRTVALKILRPKFAKNKHFTRRFLREAKSAARLDHPNIVKAYKVGKSEEGYYYFAMEYVDGEPLVKRVKREGPLDCREATEIVIAVAQGLAHAEDKGLIHRDIKPDNILVDENGTPKIADFGLAKADDDPTVTQAGGVLGSPNYMSPEQAKGEQKIDGRTDIYALGASYYHLLTGKPPFIGETAGVVIAKHIDEPPPSAHEANSSVPEDVSHVILKTMAKEPAARYQTAGELIDDLERFLNGERPEAAIASAPPLRPLRRRRPSPPPLRDEPRRPSPEKHPKGKLRPGKKKADKPRSEKEPEGEGRQPEKAPRPPLRRPKSAEPEHRKPPVVVQVAVAGLSGVILACLIGLLTRTDTEDDAPSKRPKRPRPTTTRPDKRPVRGQASTTIEGTVPLPVSQAREVAAGRALEQAETFRRENPTDYRGQFDKFDDITARYPETKARAKAADALEAVAAEWDKKAQDALNRLEIETELLARRHSYGKAIELLAGFPPNLMDQRWAREVEALGDRCRKQAADSFQAATVKAKTLIDQRDYLKAVKMLEPALQWGIEALSEQAKAEIAAIHDRAAVAQAEEEGKGVFAIKDLMDNAGPLIAARDYDKAKQFLAARRKESLSAPESELLGQLDTYLVKLVEFLHAAEQGLSKINSGDTLSIQGREGQYRFYRDGKVYLNAGGPDFGCRLDEMRPDELSGLLRRALGSDSAATHLYLAVFQISDRRADHTAARRHFDTAAEKGAEVGPYREVFELFESEMADIKAQALFAEAKVVLAKKDWMGAVKALGQLRTQYGRSKFVVTCSADIAAKTQIAEEAIGPYLEKQFQEAVGHYNRGRLQPCQQILAKLTTDYEGSRFIRDRQDQINDLLKTVGGAAPSPEPSPEPDPEANQPSGFIEDWRVIGPFDNTGKEGFAKAFPPETKISFISYYSGKDGRTVRWSRALEPAKPGLIDLRRCVGRIPDAVAYAYTTVVSPTEAEVQVRAGSADTMTVWLNGEKVLEKAKWEGKLVVDEHVAPARLRQGKNTILLKICQGEDDPRWDNHWGFYFRLTDADGNSMDLKDTKGKAP